MSADTTVKSSTPPIPKKYWAWLSGLTLSSLGTQVLGFAMAWVAAGYGGAFAGLVLTAINLPRTVLLLFGGAIADRLGAWKVMISGDVAMTIVTATFAISLLSWGPSPGLLLVMAFLIGVVDAFYIPASGSMPRRLVSDAKLTQAMSARQISSQLTSVLGAPLGALIVAGLGLAAAAVVNSVTFAAMFVLLLLIHPKGETAHLAQVPADTPKPSVLKTALEGLSLSAKDPLLRPVLLMLIGSAAFLLPVLAPLLPVLARQNGWAPTEVGIVVGVSAAGTVAVAVCVLLAGSMARPGLAGCGGLALAALGVSVLATIHGIVPSIVAGALIGLGTGLFSTHLGPLVLGRTPSTHLGRVQAIVAIAQSLPLLITNVALGALAQAMNAEVALVLCAAGLLAVAIIGVASPEVRTARRLGAK